MGSDMPEFVFKRGAVAPSFVLANGMKDVHGTCEVDNVVTPKSNRKSSGRLFQSAAHRRCAWQEACDSNIEAVIKERNFNREEKDDPTPGTPKRRVQDRNDKRKALDRVSVQSTIQRPESIVADAWIGAAMHKYNHHEVSRGMTFGRPEIFLRNNRLHENYRNKAFSGVQFGTSKRFDLSSNIRESTHLPPSKVAGLNAACVVDIAANSVHPSIQHQVSRSPIKYSQSTNRFGQATFCGANDLRLNFVTNLDITPPDVGPGKYSVHRVTPKFKRHTESATFKSQGHVPMGGI